MRRFVSQRDGGRCELCQLDCCALVRDLQRGGFDVQMTGFGLMTSYHADNECCKLSDMGKGFRVLLGVIAELE